MGRVPLTSAPTLGRREADRLRATVVAIALMLSTLCVAMGVAVALFMQDPGSRFWSLVVLVAGALGSIALVKRGRIWAGSLLLVLGLVLGISSGLLVAGNLFVPAVASLQLAVIVAGLLLGTRGALLAAAFSVATLGVLFWQASESSTAAVFFHHTPASAFWVHTSSIAAAAFVISVAVRRIQEALRGLSASEASLTRRNRELEEEIQTRKRAEAALRASEERFRALVEHSEDAIIEIDRSGRVLFHSNADDAPALNDIAADPQSLRQRVHPEDRESAAHFGRLLWENGHLRGEPFRVRTENGGWRWLELSAATYRRDDGERRAVAVSRDVTDRKQAEDLVRDNEQRFRALAGNVREIIGEYDRDAGFVYLSPRFEEVLGPEAREIAKSDPAALVHPDDAEAARRCFETVFERREAVELTLRLRHQNGCWRSFEASVRPLTVASGELRAVISARDVTESLELEQRLRASQKLEAVARLAGGIAHDFNNLLTVVLGHSESLLGSSALRIEQREELRQIQESARRGDALVKQLLAFGRGQVLESRRLDLNAVVAEMERLLRPLIGENVQLETRLGPGPLWLEADPSRLEQVIANLVVNARDAISDTGRVTIETRVCEGVDGRPGADGVRLTVRDTGGGMDDGVAERIFEPFFTTKEAGKGTGLGLSTVHGIVEQSGGKIEVETSLGTGTTFHVILPRAVGPTPIVSEAASATLPRESVGDRGTGTILLVEDESLVRRMVCNLLRQEGYRVLSASNGSEALETARDHDGEIDLLLSDLVMPEMGGFELREKLAAARPGLKSLFMSGYGEHPAKVAGGPAPAGPTLAKPFRRRQLIDRVHEAMHG